MRRLGESWLLAALVLAPMPCLAQQRYAGPYGSPEMPGQELTVKIKIQTTGGNVIAGTFAARAMKIRTEELGTLEIPCGQLSAIQFGRDGDRDVIQTGAGSTLVGEIEGQEFTIRSEFGPITLPRAKIAGVEVLSAVFVPVEGNSPAPPGSKAGAEGPAWWESLFGKGGTKAEPSAKAERPARPSPIPGFLLAPGQGARAQAAPRPWPQPCPVPIVRREVMFRAHRR